MKYTIFAIIVAVITIPIGLQLMEVQLNTFPKTLGWGLASIGAMCVQDVIRNIKSK